MLALLNIFANNLLPILLLAGSGFLLGRVLHVESRPLGRVIFYILSPVLVFHLLVESQLPVDRIILMVAFASAVMFASAGLAYLTGRLLRLERTSLIIVTLTSLSSNAGNYGLPVVAFAFGDQALAYAGIYFVTSAILTNTVGVLIASLDHLNWKQALLGLLKVPSVYATLLAVVFIYTGWQLPGALERTVSLGAQGSVPAMLILLGLELQRAEWSRNLRVLGVSTIIRLVVSPLIGLGLSGLFGMQGPARQAAITEAGMPSAVLTTVLASEYKLDPSLVTAVVFVSTILSPVTLTALLFFLGR